MSEAEKQTTGRPMPGPGGRGMSSPPGRTGVRSISWS